MKQFDAYVADSNMTGSKGETRRGVWKLRPVARFEEFFKAAKGLGELVTSGISSVTSAKSITTSTPASATRPRRRNACSSCWKNGRASWKT